MLPIEKNGSDYFLINFVDANWSGIFYQLHALKKLEIKFEDVMKDIRNYDLPVSPRSHLPWMSNKGIII